MGELTNDTFGRRSGGALVIGASGAIGRAVALRLARAGSAVTATYAGNRAAAEVLVKELEGEGLDGRIDQLDLADPESVRAAVDAAVEAHGGLHCVVLAASPTNWQSYVSALDP